MKHRVQAYIIWIVANLFVIYSFSLNTASGVFAEVIKNSLQLNSVQVSLAMGSFIFGFAIMQIPGGYFLDRLNARFVVSTAILLLALGNFAISLSSTLLTFILSNFLQGMGASIAFISTAVLISQWFPKNLFPILFGFTQAFSCVLAGVIHYVFSIALKTYSWNEIYQVLGSIGFCIFVLSIMLIKSPLTQKKVHISLANSLKAVFCDEQIMLATVAAATSFGVLLAYASFWYLEVQKFYAVEIEQAIIIGGMIFLGIGIGSPVMAILSNYFKSRILIIHTSLVLGVMALLVGLYLPHFEQQSLALVKIIAFFIGFFLSGSSLLYTVVNEISTDNTRGVALSVLNMTTFLFNTIMLFVPYWFVTPFSKDYFTYLWVLPFFIMFSILLLYFIKDSYTTNHNSH